MVDVMLRSFHQGEIMIKDTIALLEPDLHIITKEGAPLLTNKFLISQGSPILRRLLNDDHMSPSVLHLPDVTAPALLHLISVIKNGFTTGPGDGYSVIKAVREVAQVLAFENVPVLTFEVERQSQPAEFEDLRQNALEGSHESEMDISDYKAGEVSTDPGEVDYLIKIEFEDNQVENSSNDEDNGNISSVEKAGCTNDTVKMRGDDDDFEDTRDEVYLARHDRAAAALENGLLDQSWNDHGGKVPQDRAAAAPEDGLQDESWNNHGEKVPQDRAAAALENGLLDQSWNDHGEKVPQDRAAAAPEDGLQDESWNDQEVKIRHDRSAAPLEAEKMGQSQDYMKSAGTGDLTLK